MGMGTRLYSNLPPPMEENPYGGSTATYCNLPPYSRGIEKIMKFEILFTFVILFIAIVKIFKE